MLKLGSLYREVPAGSDNCPKKIIHVRHGYCLHHHFCAPVVAAGDRVAGTTGNARCGALLADVGFDGHQCGTWQGALHDRH